MRYPLQAALAATLALVASPVLADVDANGDGEVTFEELAAVIDIGEGEFANLDANGDGVLDEEEIASAQEQGSLPENL